VASVARVVTGRQVDDDVTLAVDRRRHVAPRLNLAVRDVADLEVRRRRGFLCRRARDGCGEERRGEKPRNERCCSHVEFPSSSAVETRPERVYAASVEPIATTRTESCALWRLPSSTSSSATRKTFRRAPRFGLMLERSGLLCSHLDDARWKSAP